MPPGRSGAVIDRLHVLASSRSEKLRDDLAASRRDPVTASAIVVDIGAELFAGMRGDPLLARCLTAPPVFVLRGGLLMRDAYREVFGNRPIGMIVPMRPIHRQTPDIAFASVPSRAPHYLIVDVITASGRTMDACIRSLGQRMGVSDASLSLVTPFLSAFAREHLLSMFPRLHIYCLWDDERIDDQGRLIGPGFDVGDYALGGPSGGLTSWVGA